MIKRTPTDFIPGGTSQDQYKIDVVKRLGKDVELDAWVQVERWKAPIYIQKTDNGANIDNAVAFQLTWFPEAAYGGEERGAGFAAVARRRWDD